MPRNGETNAKFGVYKNLCCNEEIVIAEGATFPDCRRHINLTTEWKPLVTDRQIVHASEFSRRKDPAA
jgi:hypothetical protein